jgi:hypothetical protein
MIAHAARVVCPGTDSLGPPADEALNLFGATVLIQLSKIDWKPPADKYQSELDAGPLPLLTTGIRPIPRHRLHRA